MLQRFPADLLNCPGIVHIGVTFEVYPVRYKGVGLMHAKSFKAAVAASSIILVILSQLLS